MSQDLEKVEGRSRATTVPRVDVYESDAELLLAVDVPGASKEGVDVRFDDGQLVIEAKRQPPSGGASLGEEWSPRDYRRAFAIPEGIDVEKVDAELDSGVLKVRLPKAPQKQIRRIDVRSA